MAKKNLPGESEIKIVHTCTQALVIQKQETALRSQLRATKRNTILLARLSKVSLGNGHEEDGLLYIVRKFVKEHKGVLTDIQGIKESLSIVTQANMEMDVQVRVREKVKQILEEKEEEEKDKEEIKLRKASFNWSKVPVIVGVLTLVTIAIFSYLNYNLSRETKSDTSTIKTETGITNDILIPDKTRGSYYNPFANDTLK